ncbi:MAG: hypothetical protein HY329_06945 [Chloroflexi bacterium]|nr:hypothetical protein [Chloroflexota bacterium]
MTKKKIYRGYRDGYRTSEPLFVFVQDGDGERRPLPGVLPPGTWDRGSGFEWGYDGAGPRNLAVAILTDYLGCQPHHWIIDRFVRQVIAKLDVSKPWVITSTELAGWLTQRRRAKSFVLCADSR